MDGAAPHFTAHNIRLDDGSQTLPEAGRTIGELPLFLSVARMLRTMFPGGLAGRSIIDIGCLEGGYATEFARLGMDAVGLDVRRSNIEACEWVRARVDLPNLRFVQDDAANLDRHGPFDVVFMNGLFYHLEHPRRMMESVGRNCRKAVFIQTHFTQPGDSAAVAHFGLSEMTEHEGLQGRWYHEHGDVPPDVLDRDMRWASWSNTRSFWLDKPDLLHLLALSGFDIVLEQYDQLGRPLAKRIRTGAYALQDRSLFAGIKA